MASAVDALLSELLTSDEEEEETPEQRTAAAAPQPSSAGPATAAEVAAPPPPETQAGPASVLTTEAEHVASAPLGLQTQPGGIHTGTGGTPVPAATAAAGPSSAAATLLPPAAAEPATQAAEAAAVSRQPVTADSLLLGGGSGAGSGVDKQQPDPLTVQGSPPASPAAAAAPSAMPAAPAATTLAGSFDLLGDFGDSDALLSPVPADQAASLPTAAALPAVPDFGDLLGGLVVGPAAAAPGPAAAQAAAAAAGWEGEPEATAASPANLPPLQPLDAAMAALSMGAQPPAEHSSGAAAGRSAAEPPFPAAAAAAAEAAPPTDYLEASTGFSGVYSGGLSDVETSADGGGEPAAAAAQPASAAAAGASDVTAGPADEALAAGSDSGLSDISTDTDAESDAELAVADTEEQAQQPWQQQQQQQQSVDAQQSVAEPAAGQLPSTEWEGHADSAGMRHAREQEARGVPKPLPPAPPLLQEQQQQPSHQQHQQHQQQQPGVLLLQAAERLEARLAAGDSSSTDGSTAGVAAVAVEDAAYRDDLLLASIVSQLELEAAAAAGGQGSSSSGGSEGAVLGRLAAARAFLSPNFEQLFRGPQAAGQPSAVTKYLGMAAVGTSTGAVFVLLPGMPATAAAAAGGGKQQAPQQQQPPRLLEVGDKQLQQRDAATALCMGQHGSSILLLVGHASGAVKVWELKTQLAGGVHFVLTKSLGGMHATAVTATALLDGGGTTWALTADAHGRLMCHNLSKHLSVAASAISSFARGLTGGGGSGPSHLIPLQQAAAGTSFDPGVVCSLLPLHAGSGASSLASGSSSSSSGSGGQQQFAHDAAAAMFVPDAGHFLLLVCTRAVLVCLLTPEGRLQMLHVFLPPHNTPADCSPYATWRLVSGGSGSAAQQGHPAGAVSVLLAVAWQHSMSVYTAVLLQQRGGQQPVAGNQQQQLQQQQQQQQLPPPSLLRSWNVAGSGGAGSLGAAAGGSSSSLSSNGGAGSGSGSADGDAGVCGCYFLDSGPLVVLSQPGETCTAVDVYRKDYYAVSSSSGSSSHDAASSSSSEAVDGLVLRDWVVSSQALAAGSSSSSSFHQSAGGFGDQMLLLTSHGVRVVQLLSWQQRLSALASQQQQQLVAALVAAVRIHQAAAAAAAADEGSGGQGRLPQLQSAWPADGHAAVVPEVQRQLLTILCAYVDQHLAKLQTAAAAESPAAAAAAAQLAVTATACCLLVRRPDALWSHLFPRFSRQREAAAAFLQQLLPFILTDQLPSMAPEVMQALVEHYVAAGRPEQVERCVLKMDILSLDLNQLIPLCIRHRLFAALLHIFPRALQDHQTPAALLLVAAAAATESEAAAAGQAGPAGQAAPIDAAAASLLLQQHESLRLGYKLLVFLRCCLLGQNYPPGTGRAPPEQRQRAKAQAIAFVLYTTGLSVWECWRLWGEVAHSQEAAAVLQLPHSIQDPHPALRFLCQLDAPGVLGMLRQGLDGWDALETDLAEVSPDIASQIVLDGASRTIAQAVVDAVVALLESGAFTSSSRECGGGSGGGSQGAGAATAAPLTSPAAAAAAGETAALQFLAAHLASNRAVASGGVLLRVLQHLAPAAAAAAGLAGPAPAAGAVDMPAAEREAVFCDVVSAAGSSMSPADQQQAIFLARRAGFLQAEARVRHAEGAHGDALACLARDSRHPAAVFKYVRDVLADAGLTKQQRTGFTAATLRQAPQLLALDAHAASQLVLDCFPEHQQALLAQLQQHPDQQFAFLKGLVAIQQQQQAGGPAGSSSAAVGDSSLKASGRSPQLRNLLGDMGVANLYLKLLCQYEPRSVLPYLQSHDAYAVDDCLQHCLEHRIQDGAAFLLERRGDVHSALKIYIQNLDRANRELVAAVRTGTLDLAAASAAAVASAVDGSSNLAGRRTAGSPVVLHRRPALSRAGSNGTAAAAASAALLDSSLPPPPELQAARDALGSALAMCLRYSQDRVALDSSATLYRQYVAAMGSEAEVAADPLQQLWFQVLHCYVRLLRELRQGEELDNYQQTSTSNTPQGKWQLEILQEAFTGFMEEVIGSMAGQVPLRSIADVIMQQYGGDEWGDFKGTLLGLLTACGAELSILKCATRVVAADGADILSGGYRKCMRPASIPTIANNVIADANMPEQARSCLDQGMTVSLQGWVQRGTAMGGEMFYKAAGIAAGTGNTNMAGKPSKRVSFAADSHSG